jgi:hypothetical protein
VVAEATLPAGPAWPQEAVEQALEALATLLEGEGDQELVIHGTGADGDLRLEPSASGTPGGVGEPPARPQAKVAGRRGQATLGLVVEGAPAAVRQAVGLLLRELGRWVAVDLVRVEWSRASGRAAAGRGGALARCH